MFYFSWLFFYFHLANKICSVMYFISDLSCSNSSWFTAVHSVALSRASYNYVHAWAWLSRRRCDVSLPLGYVLLLIYGGLWSRKIVTSLSNRRQVIAIYCLVTRLTTFHGKLRQWSTLASFRLKIQGVLPFLPLPSCVFLPLCHCCSYIGLYPAVVRRALWATAAGSEPPAEMEFDTI